MRISDWSSDVCSSDLSGDVRDYAAIRGVMETVAEKLGSMDIVISGAAGNFLAPVLGMSANAFRPVFDIDLTCTFNVFPGCHDLLNRPIRSTSFQEHVCQYCSFSVVPVFLKKT